MLLLALPLLALPPLAHAAEPLPAAAPEEPLIGGELRLQRGEGASTLPLVAQRLDLDVGLVEAQATLSQRFEAPPEGSERARWALAVPAGALLLAASVSVDGRLHDAPLLEDGTLSLELGALPGGAMVTATVDLALPVQWTGSGSALELPSAARLGAAAPWLEAEAPENEVELWFGREVAGLVLDEGRLALEVEADEPLVLEWRELEGASGFGAARGGASCFYSDYSVSPPKMACAGVDLHGGMGRGVGIGGLQRWLEERLQDPSAEDEGCADPAGSGQGSFAQVAQLGAGSLSRGLSASEVGYDDRTARAATPTAKGVAPPELGRAVPEASPDDRALVDRRIRRDLNAIRACYREALRLNPELEGTVTLTFIVQENGMIGELRVAESDLDHPEAEACLVEQLRWMRFHEPEAAFSVRYPFRFSPAQTAGL